MAIVQIPLRNDLPSYTFNITLSGEVFKFAFKWNSRNENWYFDVFKTDETPVILGQPVLVNYAVLDRFSNNDLPEGKLFFIDTSNKKLDPGRFDLGERVKFIYNDD